MKKLFNLLLTALLAVYAIGVIRAAEPVLDENLAAPTNLKAVVGVDGFGNHMVTFTCAIPANTKFQVEVKAEDEPEAEFLPELGSEYLEWKIDETGVTGKYTWRARTVTVEILDGGGATENVLTYSNWVDGPAFNADEITSIELEKPSGISVRLEQIGVIEVSWNAVFYWTSPAAGQYCEFYIYNAQNQKVGECRGVKSGDATWGYEYAHMPAGTYTFKARGVALAGDAVTVLSSTDWVESEDFTFTLTEDYSLPEVELDKPTGMTAAVNLSAKSVEFGWDFSSELAYEIEVYQGENRVYHKPLASMGADQWSYGQEDAEYEGEFTWKIRALKCEEGNLENVLGRSDWADGPAFTINPQGEETVPLPTDPQAKVNGHEVTLSWGAVEDNYYLVKIYNKDGQLMGDSPDGFLTADLIIAAMLKDGRYAWTFTELPDGEYTWTVQTLNLAYENSDPVEGPAFTLPGDSTAEEPADTIPTPTNLNAQVNGHEVTLSWDAVKGLWYTVNVYTARTQMPAAAPADLEATEDGRMSHVFTDMEDGEYIWYVTASNKEQTLYSQTAEGTFTVGGSQQTDATPANLNVTVNGTEVTFSWDALDGFYYTLYVYKGQEFPVYEEFEPEDIENGKITYTTNKIPAGTWSWYVYATDEDEEWTSDDVDGDDFTVEGEVSAVPAPEELEVEAGTETVTFSCDGKANHMYVVRIYEVGGTEYKTTLNMNTRPLGEDGRVEKGISTRMLIAQVGGTGSYRWTVTAKNTAGEMSEEVQGPVFRLDTVPAAEVPAPENLNVEVAGDSVVFSWDALAGLSYELWVLNVADEEDYLIEEFFPRNEPGRIVWATRQLTPGATYRWFVNAVDEDENVSEDANGENFTVPEESSVEKALLSGVSLYPNPCAGAFTLQVPAKVSVDIYGLDGKQVESRTGVKGTARFHLARPGIYMVRISSGSAVVVKKVVVR